MGMAENFLHRHPMRKAMTDTEKLLEAAQELARRKFDDPSQETVMSLFLRLCEEYDRKVLQEPGPAGATVH